MSKLNFGNIFLLVIVVGVLAVGYMKCQSDRASYLTKDSTEKYDYGNERPFKHDSLQGIETESKPKPNEYSAPPVGGEATVGTPQKTTAQPSSGSTPNLKDTDIGRPEKVSSEPVPSTVTPSAPAAPSGAQAKATTVYSDRSILYVTIDRLKLRTEPNLKSKTLRRLKLHEKVYFANERTDFKEEINLGLEMAYEPWLKVETLDGKVGWVYGAGVDIMKTVREGVR